MPIIFEIFLAGVSVHKTAQKHVILLTVCYNKIIRQQVGEEKATCCCLKAGNQLIDSFVVHLLPILTEQKSRDISKRRKERNHQKSERPDSKMPQDTVKTELKAEVKEEDLNGSLLLSAISEISLLLNSTITAPTFLFELTLNSEKSDPTVLQEKLRAAIELKRKSRGVDDDAPPKKRIKVTVLFKNTSY